MRLGLIQPAREANTQRSKKSLAPPLNLGLLAALTPSDVEICITDENTSIIDFERDVDLVGITTLTFGILHISLVCAKLKVNYHH